MAGGKRNIQSPRWSAGGPAGQQADRAAADRATAERNAAARAAQAEAVRERERERLARDADARAAQAEEQPAAADEAEFPPLGTPVAGRRGAARPEPARDDPAAVAARIAEVAQAEAARAQAAEDARRAADAAQREAAAAARPERAVAGGGAGAAPEPPAGGAAAPGGGGGGGAGPGVEGEDEGPGIYNLNIPNGPAEVGIAVDVDTLPGTVAHLEIVDSPDVAVRVASAIQSVLNSRGGNAVNRYDHTAILCAMWVAHYDLWDERCHVVAVNEMEIDDVAVQEAMDDALRDIPYGKATTVMCATKVNWWMMNHHIGQGAIVGYVAKVLAAYGFPDATPRDRTTVWTLGHWLSTKAVLTAWGVRNITRVVNGRNGQPCGPIPAASDDILKRIRGPPAGTHVLTTHYQALGSIAGSSMRSAVGNMYGVHAWHASYVAIMANPAAYHQGAAYLTGNAKLDFVRPSDGHMRSIAAFVHANQPNSTLAQAKVLYPQTEIAGSAEYAAILGVIKALKNPTTQAALAKQLMSVSNNSNISDWLAGRDIAPEAGPVAAAPAAAIAPAAAE